jgi:Ni,Fe-hydrogenase III large subunit
MVRAREVKQSVSIVRQVLDALPPRSEAELAAGLPRQLPARASALGWVEGWRGQCTHWVATDDRGEIARVKIADASALNWPGIIQAVPGNIVPDFPVINKSFNFSYSGNDL